MQAPAPKSATAHRPRRQETDGSRAERKRIQDRLAQRATRERTKNRIAYLEQRLSSLEASDKAGELASLTRTIESLHNDKNRLRNALVRMRTSMDQALLMTDERPGIPSTSKSCACDLQCSCTQKATTSAFEVTTPTFSCASRHDSVSTNGAERMETVSGNGGSSSNMAADMPGPEAATGLSGVEDYFDFNPIALLEAFEMGAATNDNNHNHHHDNSSWIPHTPSPFDYRMWPVETTLKIAPDAEKWHVSNGAFINCLESVKKRTATTTTLDLHVPFKAAIWGWDNVGPEAQHPVWDALRQVDQRVMGTWTSKAQRVALMYVCQTLIQYRENPTKANLDRVPGFLRPRPSQENIQHPAVIDFLIWPGLRDRLVFEYQKYTATGAFSAAFVQNFHFHWPYPDRDIFVYNPLQGRYEVSPVFVEYAYNFKNWTMRPDFFKQFPEMQHDIAATDDTLDLPRPSYAV